MNKISILVTNYNKGKFLGKSLKKISEQNFSNFEIILYDDNSSDNSSEIIKKFPKIKFIKNKKKFSNFGPLNQIRGIIKAFNQSKGNIICLMDADDFFLKNKLSLISNFFEENKKLNIVFDIPKDDIRNKFSIKKKMNKNIWPTIFPTSCISIRRQTFKIFIKNLYEKKFNRLEIDARLCIFSKFFLNEYNILNKELTEYNYDPKGITAQILKFSHLWWVRRLQAFNYLKIIKQKKKIKF